MNLERFSIGASAIIRAVRPPGGYQSDILLLKAIAPGVTDLWVWKSDGSAEHRTVRVVKWSKDSIPLDLRRALDSLTETEIIPTGSGFVLRGEIRSIEELTRVRRLAREFPKKIAQETRAAPLLLDEGETLVRTWLSENGLGERLRVTRLGSELLVRGNVASTEQAESVRAQLAALFAATRFEIDSLPSTGETVYFRVSLLEIQRERFQSLGLNWRNLRDGAFRITAPPFQAAAQLEGMLEALARQGSARVLSQPELSVRAPGEAELFAGGELPIRTHTRFQANIAWRRFGLTLKLHVAGISGDRIRLDVFSEVSHLDSNIGSDDVPGLRANTMRTQVDAVFGRPLLLSGLIHEGMRKQAKGLPFLKDIPVLGRLFGSEDYLNERSELMAILLPNRLVPPVPEERFGVSLPKGPVPPPRNWISPEKERRLRDDSRFPWNAFAPESGGGKEDAS